MIGKSNETEAKTSVFRRIGSLRLSKKVVLYIAVCLLLASIGIAAAARYKANKEAHAGSSAAEQAPHDEFNAFLTDCLPEYGVVPQETPLHVADAAGVIAAYIPPAGEDLLICRIEGKDLVLGRCGKTADGTVSAPEEYRYPDLFSEIYNAGEPLVISAAPDGISVGKTTVMQLQAPDTATETVAVIQAEDKSRSWELSSYLVRDFTAFRNEVTLPPEHARTEMPEITGMDWEEAVQRITERGLVPQIEPEQISVNAEDPRGLVLAQAPEPGSKCLTGSTVYLTVAAESFVFSFEVPPHTAGDFTVILYDESGTETARSQFTAADAEEPEASYVWAMKYAESCDFQAVLENNETGKTTSLGAYTADSDKVTADSAITEFAFAQIGGIRTEAETTAPPEEGPAEPDRSAEWKQLYLSYLNDGLNGGFKSSYQSSLRCDLIDLDGSGVPALVLGATEQNKRIAWICTIVDGEVRETEHFANGFRYLEGQNRIFTELHTGYLAEYRILTLKNGQAEILQSFEEHWSKTDGYSYKTDAKTITREEYNAGLKKAYEVPDQTEWKYPVSGWPATEKNISKYLQT